MLFVMAIILITWINYFQNYWIPSIIAINTIKTNNLIETISFSFVTSYIFYYIVVELKDKYDKKILFPFIADYTYVTLNNCVMFCSVMRDWAKIQKIEINTCIYDRNSDIYPTEEEVKTICLAINPNEGKNKDLGLEGIRIIPHFYGIMIKYIHDIDYFLKIILEKSIFLDTELIRILTDIQTSGLQQSMISYTKAQMFTAKHTEPNLEVFEKSFISYFNLFRKLEDYSEKKLKKFVER